MVHPVPTLSRITVRQWHPGNPLPRRRSRLRRIATPILLVLFSVIIAGYWYLTDSDRVRMLTESYLEEVLNGPVSIGQATLSIFEGLKLEDVVVKVDKSRVADATILSAKEFRIDYNVRAMLRGRLEAGQIVAVEPHVRLNENLDTGRWNFHRMMRQAPTTRPATTRPRAPAAERPPMSLPELLLRNARVEYVQTRGDSIVSRGTYVLDGKLRPAQEQGQYQFDLQTRGTSQAIGPVLHGWFSIPKEQFHAELLGIQFDSDIRGILPLQQVRQFWDKHELKGRMDVPRISYIGGRGKAPAQFEVITDLRSVTLAVPALYSREEFSDIARARRQLGLLQATRVNGQVIDNFTIAHARPPLRLHEVQGRLVFTEEGIAVNDLRGRIGKNGLGINGRIDGYSPAAPISIEIASLPQEVISLSAKPDFVPAMPPALRKIYDVFRPQGDCTVKVNIERGSGGKIKTRGRIDVIDGRFAFDEFPYPLRKVTGAIVIDENPDNGEERVVLKELRGRGIRNGPNKDVVVELDGAIGPFTSALGVHVRVIGKGIRNEPALMDAFPKEVQRALRMFDADDTGDFPKYGGDFECNIIRPRGRRQKWQINTDVTINSASGKPVVFPYQLENVKATLKVRNDYLDIINAHTLEGDAKLKIDGRVSWGRRDDATTRPTTRPVALRRATTQPAPIQPDLTIVANSVPINQKLFEALPEAERSWLEKAAMTGVVDINGRIFSNPGATRTDDINYAIGVTIRDGTALKREDGPLLTNVHAQAQLKPQELSISEARAAFGDSAVTGSGVIAWPKNQPSISIHAGAENLAMNERLYRSLPRVGQEIWEEIRPQGTLDLDLSLSGALDAPASQPATQPSTRPTLPLNYSAVVRPRELSAMLNAVPYRLNNIKGLIRVDDGSVTLENLSAKHGDGEVFVSGTGETKGLQQWALKVEAKKLPVDDELRAALPEALLTLSRQTEIQGGTLDFELPTLKYVELPEKNAQGETEADIDWTGRAALTGSSVNIGVPLSEVRGFVDTTGTYRNGELAELSGGIVVYDGKVAGRPMSNFRATLGKPTDKPAIQFTQIQGQIAGGDLDGEAVILFPDKEPPRYAVNLGLRAADVATLSGPAAEGVHGRLNASLSMQGTGGDNPTRRGRGDVSMAGDEMYQIPVVLGLLQVTNLALPIRSPFHEASAQYVIDNQRVTFESIELRSQAMLMQGNGALDFGAKRVSLTFVTDNPNWPKLPIVGDLVQGARRELLQFHVRGSIQEPKVSASAMNTFQTTVDEVLRGDRKERTEEKGK